MTPQSGAEPKRLSPATEGQWILATITALGFGIGGYVFVTAASSSFVADVEHAIAFATTVLGFVTLMLGTFMGAQATRSKEGLGDLNTLMPVGLTTAVGALLLLVGRFA